MPLVQQWLLNVPVISLVLVIALTVFAVSLVLLVFIWRLVPREIWKKHNDVTNAIFQAIAMAYTVLLAFMVVISWQNYDRAGEHIETEANCLVNLYRNGEGISPAFQAELLKRLQDYGQSVMEDEWKLLARSQESMKTREALKEVWALYQKYEPKTQREQIFFSESISQLNKLREIRRLRILDSRTTVHPLLWFLLIIGGVATVGFSLILGADSFYLHLIMTSLLAVFISLILFMILMFDYPFTGSFGISPNAYRQVIGI